MRDIVVRLEDHDAGEKLLHEAAAAIKALRSRLSSCELDLSTARQSLYEVAEQRNNAMQDAFQKGCRLGAIALPRKRPFAMTMHKVEGPRAAQ
jgi:hypothetical protein